MSFRDLSKNFSRAKAKQLHAVISQHYFTFWFQIPRICVLFKNWPQYLFNYLTRRKKPAEYHLRGGFRLIDGTGTLAGTIAVVFVRREYGAMGDFRTIVDIGGNMGCFTIFAARSCPQARIFSFEPVRQNFGFLTQNIAINSLQSRVVATECAVAGQSGEMEMALDESPLHSLVKASKSGVHQKVQCITLGEILARHQLAHIDLLKVNCEGAEYGIFENCAAADLERIANIRLEYHHLDELKQNGKALAQLLQSRGYRIERYTNYRGVSGFIWATRASGPSSR